jgi:HTH-type transcriptional regulator, quorum sensing regulator NprR
MYYKSYEKLVNDLNTSLDDDQVQEGIGTYIKNERIALGLNQDYVCKDICSISHYSRIENNLIQPSKEHLNDIFKKLNKSIPKNINQELARISLEHWFDALLNENLEEMDHIYQMIHTKDKSLKSYLIEFMYFIAKKEWDMAKVCLKRCNSFQKSFSKTELHLFLYATGEYYLNQKHYQEALNFFNLVSKLNLEPQIYQGRLYYLHAKAFSRLNQSVKALFNIWKAEEYFQERYHYNYFIKIQIFRGIELMNHYQERSMAIFESLLKKDFVKRRLKLYTLCTFKCACVYKNLKELDKCYDGFQQLFSLLPGGDPSGELMVEYIDLLIQMNKLEEAKQSLNQLKNIRVLSMQVKHQMIYYNLLLLNLPTVDKISILMHQLIPFAVAKKEFSLEKQWRLSLINELELGGNFEASSHQYRLLLANLFQKEIM